MSSRYAGKVGAYEVWNEPNYYVAYSPAPDPAGYTALLKAAYPAIKEGDPNAEVIGAVVGSTLTWGNYTMNPVDFIQQMYADGAAGSFDALSFHPYQNTLMFSQGPSVSTESPLSQLTRIRDLMSANGDASKEIWASEYGLPTGTVGEQNQATFVGDFLNTWSTLPYAGPAFLYTLNDRNTADTTDPENTFGIYRDDGTAKPVAAVIQQFIATHPTSSSSVARNAALVSSASTTEPSTTAASSGTKASSGTTDASAAESTAAAPNTTAAATTAPATSAAPSATAESTTDEPTTAATTGSPAAASADTPPATATTATTPQSTAPEPTAEDSAVPPSTAEQTAVTTAAP
jgi:hypothetical protein